MRKHLLSILYPGLYLIAFQPAHAQGIIATHHGDGRVVYENAPLPVSASLATSVAAVSETKLVYWSNTEHRWKRVPPMNSNSMRAAQSAAEEVRWLIHLRARKNPRLAAAGMALTLASEQVTTARQPERTLMPSTPAETRQALPSQATTAAAALPQAAAGPAWIDTIVEQAALRHDVDPNLVRAIIKVESNFNPHAVSRKGAMGLMQLMPRTAKSLNVSNPFDPRQNVDAGVRHFKGLLDSYGGDLELSLAAYNAGFSAVQKKRGVPNYSETRNYVRRITNLYGSKTTARLLGSTHSLEFKRDAEGHLSVSDID